MPKDLSKWHCGESESSDTELPQVMVPIATISILRIFILTFFARVAAARSESDVAGGSVRRSAMKSPRGTLVLRAEARCGPPDHHYRPSAKKATHRRVTFFL